MTVINSYVNHVSLFLLFSLLISYSASSKAMEMDHSGHNMGSESEEETGKKKKVSPWPESDDVDAWADEEFTRDLNEELNTEIGIVVHHQHKSGNWMVSYKYMSMYMEGLISGTQEMKDNIPLTTEEVARTLMGSTPPATVPGFDYLMAPVDMKMNMHMLMAMYGLNKNTSLMFMTNYMQNDMNMVMHMGNETTIAKSNYSDMATAGISDTGINAMIRASDSWILSFGVSLPTGSIDEDVLMNGNTIQAPYKMQLGTGTVDFLQAVTYKGGDSSFNWGAQQNFRYHSGANDNGYVYGNKFEISAWLRKTFSNNFSMSTRVNMFDEGQIIGRDVKIMNQTMSPTFAAENSGRHQVDLSIGFSKRFSSGNRLGVEYSKPIVQLVNGIQMETQYSFTVSWAYMM
ncbi:MAG: hypothetical protein ACC653_11405 [Gammaproteobacteria bacterium]